MKRHLPVVKRLLRHKPLRFYSTVRLTTCILCRLFALPKQLKKITDFTKLLSERLFYGTKTCKKVPQQSKKMHRCRLTADAKYITDFVYFASQEKSGQRPLTRFGLPALLFWGNFSSCLLSLSTKARNTLSQVLSL